MYVHPRTDNPLRFAGYAGLFNIPDADRDTILPGAFTATLAAKTKALPLLWQHRPDQQIGEVESVTQDERGLRIIGRIDRTSSKAAHLLSQGEVSGLSFGYRARQAHHSDNGRELAEIDLFEVSLVTHPLQHGARVHFVS
ncbi:MAG: HK97 family phage prohead protease [Erythrobacter sp.]|uniref:HK97 family phage prohead protease n=1 Tax=Erythrobacter sp. TaxID=1042 RepID=UPI003262D7A6